MLWVWTVRRLRCNSIDIEYVVRFSSLRSGPLLSPFRVIFVALLDPLLGFTT